MMLADLKEKANKKLTIFCSALTKKQDAYFAKHGKYFQLLITPSNAVIDGVNTSFVDKAPSDDTYVVDRDFALADTIPFNIRVDEWTGPDGAGYSATVIIHLLNGDRYTRSRNNKNVDTGWYKIIPQSN